MKAVLTTAFVALAGMAGAQDVSGIWQTEAAESGGFLHVSIAPCGDKVCGTINRAFDKDLQVVDGYEHAGKQMIWDMTPDGTGKWSKGKIWDPSADKTYKSKMELAGDTLNVSGCVLVICRSQSWRKVQ